MKRGPDELKEPVNPYADDSVPPFFVSQEEWKKAERFFRPQQGWLNWSFMSLFSAPAKPVKKLKKDKGDQNSHTFIEVDGQIYVTANAQSEPDCILGEGGQGKVKLAFSRGGPTIAVKSEKETIEVLSDITYQQLKAIRPGDLECQALAHESLLLGLYKEFRQAQDGRVLEKKYTFMRRVPGEDLENITIKDLTLSQRLQIAYQCCLILQHIHDGNFVHGDIKPANIKVQIIGDAVFVKFIDFGCSFKLNAGQSQMAIPVSFGSKGYTAPEVSKGYNLGYASDVYSLGAVFTKDLKLPFQLCEGMTSYMEGSRPALAEIIHRLQTALSQAKPQDLQNTAQKRARPATQS